MKAPRYIKLVILCLLLITMLIFYLRNQSNSYVDDLLIEGETLIENKEFENARVKLETITKVYKGTTQASQANELLKVLDKEYKNHTDKINKTYVNKLKKSETLLRKEYDDISGTTFYKDKSTTNYVNVNSMYIYISKGDTTKPELMLRIQYTGDDWLFISKYIIKTDTNSYNINVSHFDVERDHSAGQVWEWYTVNVDDELLQMLKDVYMSNDVKIRYVGSTYNSDRIVTQNEKRAIKNVLDVYENL